MYGDPKYSSFQGMEPEFVVRSRDLDAYLGKLIADGQFADRDEALDAVLDDCMEKWYPAGSFGAKRYNLKVVAEGFRERADKDDIVKVVMDATYPFPTRRARRLAEATVNSALDSLGMCATARIWGWDQEVEYWGLHTSDAEEIRKQKRTVWEALGDFKNAISRALHPTTVDITSFAPLSSKKDPTETGPVSVRSYTRRQKGKDGSVTTVNVSAHTRRRPGEG